MKEGKSPSEFAHEYGVWIMLSNLYGLFGAAGVGMALSVKQHKLFILFVAVVTLSLSVFFRWQAGRVRAKYRKARGVGDQDV